MTWLMDILRICLGRTTSDKVLRDKAFNITKTSKYDGYQRDPALMFTNFLIK